jgi:hypothetical protein
MLSQRSTVRFTSKVGASARVRRPWVVVFLTLATFGIYGIVWYYKVNRELRDYGSAYGDDELGASKPLWSLLAVTLGALVIVPPLVSYLGVVRRTQRAERLATHPGASRPAIVALLVGSWALGVAGAAPAGSTLLIVLCGASMLAWVAAAALLQARFNTIWKAVPTAPPPFTEMARPEAVTAAAAR